MAVPVVELFVCLVLILLLTLPGVCEENTLKKQRIEQLHPVSDFSRHTLVKPKIYHGREKRRISDTKEKEGKHVDYLQILLESNNGDDMMLDLTLNQQLISKGFFQKHQQNGKHVIHKPGKDEINHCHYNGKVRGKPDSWTAISTCEGLSGVIFDGTELHYIETNKINDTSPEAQHFMYKHSDLMEHNKTCGYGGDARDPDHKHTATDNRFHRYKRSSDNAPTIRGPYNADKNSKYVELVLVVDNREFRELGEDIRKVIDHCKNIANIINSLYAPLNIFIALVGVVVWTEQDEINFSEDGDKTLTNFLHYRREKLIKQHPNDNAQLLTKFNFEQGVVGKALKGPMCTYEYSGGVNTDHSPVVALVATTIAHEMGHNFGMEHDTVDCKCPDDRCIMAPSSSTMAPTHWSSCSLNYLLLAFAHGMDYCLKNKPASLFDSPVCGNGFVESGEECDCGLPDHCENPCCNATTCMLHSNASCATGECCDLNTCKPKVAGTICRSAEYECDLSEYCTGQSEFCPADIFKMDAEECDGGKAFCYHGFCRTRTDQCKLLWGETGKSSDDQCYDMNVKGSRHGNCGYNKFNQSFFKCDNKSVLCGMLHCRHLNERLEFGMESVAILSHSFINKKGSIIPCRTAIVDLGTNQIDPGMTADGARCGDGKMCVNQRCVEALSLRKQTPSCQEDCNGNGWCNNRGHCHCKDGFAPPNCKYPGPGGSEDSGPASDPNAHQGVVIALFIIFLGVIPMLAVMAILIYYARYNLKINWKKFPPATFKSPSKSQGPPFPEPSKSTEANHSLLPQNSSPTQGVHNEFFGNFREFSLTPMKNEEPKVVRAAPPPPTAPPAIIDPIGWTNDAPANYQKPPPPVPKISVGPIVQKINSFRKNTLTKGINTSTAPPLPLPNPGSNARPLISSPVLESSTSSAKEVVSPLRNVTKTFSKSALEAPKNEVKMPVSKPDIPLVHDTQLDVKVEPAKKPATKENFGTISRIASFLKRYDDDKSLPKAVAKSNQIKAQKVLDKDALRSLKISDPVPQTQIDIAITALPVEAAAKKAVVMRTQSMRATSPKKRTNIQTFGFMRQPDGYKRPLSIARSRPKSPPPPVPPPGEGKSSDKFSDQYDDCLNEALGRISEKNSPESGDNIYAVIDESPTREIKKANNAPDATDSGVLGEIVSEIQNRNFDSIYSTSTLKKKKEAQRVSSPNSSDYANLSPSENEYSNMGNLKSSASTTSSGYILLFAVNVPVQERVIKKPDKDSKPILSSFRTDNSRQPFGASKKPSDPSNDNKKPSDSTSDRSTNKSATIKTSPSKNVTSYTNTNPSKTATVNRQITPPNLRTRKPSPTRPLSQASIKSNRSITNSPDLVTSCNTNSGNKNPDVVNRGSASAINKKPSITATKPTVTLKNSVKVQNTKTGPSIPSSQEKKAEVKPPLASKVTKAKSDATPIKAHLVGVKNASRSNSNVSSLQQKFEEKNGFCNLTYVVLEFEQIKLIYKILNKTQKSNISFAMNNDVGTLSQY
ncbi:unnamed protein product [Ceutorhynchus assimilis]|uniref:EGF-like domain-containing protein n=1 Tax=Ceutorhynchus assimilis TaxID=467358 RepID=A0A9N9MKS2_9CUCU|nr:unnamed protein product [Ceutorhynchus assimilis]